MKCEKCGVKLHKAGWGWSGKNKVARVRCPKCGRVIQRKGS